MYESLKQHSGNFHLYIFAFDDLCYRILTDMKLEYCTVISLKEFETPQLLQVKDSRTKAEYCWTSTSSTIEHVINNYNIDKCTYIDADLFFYQSPDVLLSELTNEKTILITEHRYSKFAKMIDEKRAGRFCVQFITFSNDLDSKKVLETWKNQCLEWCYARYENGKFGDQKYLDVWPANYNNVHILKNIGGGVAPWNINQYYIEKKQGEIIGIEKTNSNEFELIFYHFHFVRFLDNGFVDLGWNKISKATIDNLYIPYIQSLLAVEAKLEKEFREFKRVYYKNSSGNLKSFIKNKFKEITKYNLINTRDL